MQPVIINARWSCNGISVQYADYFSVLVFRCLVKWNAMHQPIPINIKRGFKHRAEFIKRTCNYTFPRYIQNRERDELTHKDLLPYRILLKKNNYATQS